MNPTDLKLTFALSTLGCLGLIIGSFLNVCIARWPEEQSVISPPSNCPGCHQNINWYDNIPLISWLLLGGKCRGCQSPISWQYPLVELVTGLLFVATTWLLWPRLALLDNTVAWVSLVVCLLLTSCTLVVSLVDWKHTIIPDEISLNLMPLGPVLAFFCPGFFLGRSFWTLDFQVPWLSALGVSLGGLILGGGGLWLLGTVATRLMKKDAMGLGDVKLLATLGSLLGPMGVLSTLLYASVLGSLVGLATLAITRSRVIPFGPWLMAGGMISLIGGPELLDSLRGSLLGS